MRTALASIAVAAWVILVGSLADFGTPEARTAFALGVAAAVPGFMFSGWILEGRRHG
jgi:hypothetical protein